MLKYGYTIAVLSVALSVAVGPIAQAVTIDWTPIGDPGNDCDPQAQGCFGAVSYAYSIGTYEVTNAQYAEFLNAIAASDPRGLYSTAMASQGGITRSGASGTYTYATIAGRENRPVNFVNVFDAMRFANWMENGQGNASTETGAYTLLGGGPVVPSNGNTVTRNANATIVLSNENEWYKAAYYDSLSASYFDYPAGLDAQTTCSTPTGAANSANCGDTSTSALPVGSYPGSASPYGTFDQGGNVFEWNETIVEAGYRGVRGGSFDVGPSNLAAGARNYVLTTFERNDTGFRLASVPEPATGLLVATGLLGLAVRRRASR